MASNCLVPEYLMVQRKDSLMFVEFVRGKYAAADGGYIVDMLNGMTADEQERVRTQEFVKLWQNVWGMSAPKKCLAVEFSTANRLHGELLRGTHGHTLAELASRITSSIPEREWGFPKGRRNIRESDDSCALREFNEETGVHCMAIHRFFSTFEEEFVGSNGVSYKHKYFLARLMNPAAYTHNVVTDTQAKEIACTRWMTYQEALSKLSAAQTRVDVLRAANHETVKIMTCGGVYYIAGVRK
jgi:ADP-ribose pyrophosphatase YjhB (NUDIX family)